MPGPVGGGRSGGGGGIGGGVRGGFSSGSHSTFTSGVHRTGSGFHHMNSGNRDPDQNNRGNGIGRALLIIILLLIFSSPFISLVGSVVSDFGSVVNVQTAVPETLLVWEEEALYFDIDTAPRAKLDESLCKPVDVWYFDMAELFEQDGEAETVEDALSYFYEKTGVQPLLVTARYINGDSAPAWDTVETYLYDLYIELFGEDEGHYIFLYLHHSDSSYTLYYIPGWDAVTVVDDDASAILMDYIEWYYQVSSSYGQMFASAFADAADLIMYADEEDTSAVPVDPDAAVVSTAPPADTVPTVESDSSEILTVPVTELIGEPENSMVESVSDESMTATVDVSYYEEPDTGIVWEENLTEENESETAWEDALFALPAEGFVGEDILQYIAGGAVIVLAVILFVVYFLWQKKKMRDLEDDM